MPLRFLFWFGFLDAAARRLDAFRHWLLLLSGASHPEQLHGSSCGDGRAGEKSGRIELKAKGDGWGGEPQPGGALHRPSASRFGGQDPSPYLPSAPPKGTSSLFLHPPIIPDASPFIPPLFSPFGYFHPLGSSSTPSSSSPSHLNPPPLNRPGSLCAPPSSSSSSLSLTSPLPLGPLSRVPP